MAEEKELIKKRASFKGRLTVFKNYIEGLDEKSLREQDIMELQLRIGKMESLYDQYDEVQLILECSVDNSDGLYCERSEFEAIYFKSLAKAQNLLSKCNSSTDKSILNSEKSSHVGNPKLVKLPTINLPKFSGSYHNYLEFRDSFVSLIHSNEDIDDINKFHYLRACLEGAAAVVIQSVEFSSSNYSVAWKLLCDRYDNKRLLVQNHVSAIFNIEAITKESSFNLKHLMDNVNKNLRALESLGEPVKHWDTLLIYIISHKLDQKTYREWEQFKGRADKNNSITFDSFMHFMRNHADLIETLESNRHKDHPVIHKSNTKLKSMISVRNSSNESPPKTCLKCNGDHKLFSCPQFLALSNDARLRLLPTYKVCFNCFQSGHFANHCKKPGCKVCKRKHNTLIHVATHKPTESTSSSRCEIDSSYSSSNQEANDVALSANIFASNNVKQSEVLLSTALIKLCHSNGDEHVVRAVLDSGSTSCLITERLCQRLNLVTRKIDKSILGINSVISHVGKTCRVNIKSLDNAFSTDLHCFVLPLITNNVPCNEIDLSNLKIPSNICLADPTFYKPGAVDILIGADLFWDLLGSQKIRLSKGTPALCETKLGWIISGPVVSNHITLLTNNIKCNLTNVIPCEDSGINLIRHDLTRFWQLEEVNCNVSTYSPEEKLCEEHFIRNTTRLSNGRFCVRIPLKQKPDVLGDSFHRASQCLFSLERRLKVKPDLSKMYYDFMSEYQSLGHMSELRNHSEAHTDHKVYYIPHHGVLRESSETTKLRVVYNASSPSTSGVSLNDIQMVGPTVQDDLLSILLRFRQHKYILAADVEKMYRQIVVHPSDRYLQEILWRNNINEPVKKYQLNTVTYGTASAPYLATRCLKQVGLDCPDNKISQIIIHDFYVDDLLTGCDDLDELKTIRKDVSKALASAKMVLRKWRSNAPQFNHEFIQSSLDLNIGSHEPSKLLGLGWHADSDELCFPINDTIPQGNSKRILLSVIARIFDPLGLIAPYVIKMKILLQKLWLDKCSWDEPLSREISKRWHDIIKTLPLLSDLRIPRIVVCDMYTKIDLHIFSDASESAYGACVYVRTVNREGNVVVRLLMAKSRVAPIKPTTIPRLELCGVLVAVRLYEKVKTSLRVDINHVYFWTDSTIVLGWLQMMPSRLQPFVRNRVAEVLDKAGSCTWRHVPTDYNSADLISRGVDISVLRNSDLWWFGPDFLKEDSSTWPSQPSRKEYLPETRPEVSLNIVDADCKMLNSLIDFRRFSNFLRLTRSMAYAVRFIQACRKQRFPTNFLSHDELKGALNILIRKCQDDSFSEYRLLLNNQTIPKKSALLKLNIFLDDDHIMRVGGRLENSNFAYEKKHPILIQSKHLFTKLLFAYEHKKLMHAGPQLLLASIRESYWPIGGRNLARASYHNCVRCRRMSGKIVTPIMGNLPQQRLLPGFAFETVGVDYAGPIMCASRQGRGCRLVKVYIAIFICFTTKAIHLELVGDLTSNHYLLALRRFISRRGKPRSIYSDNGTSFVGAYNDLSKFFKSNSDSISATLANDHIDFHFIPVYSPHFGGLWEAGVKSTKFHLQRVLGHCNLTFEELYTTLTQIEAILNSRPLSPLSSDPADCTPLTPGHFLIGRPLASLPQPDYGDLPTSHLTRFQRIEQLRQHFWVRWSKEYVAELQQRSKWRSCKDGLKINSLVVVKEDGLPPLKWRLGRVVAVHPGADGVVRVADIRTSTGTIRRSFTKICPLPIPVSSC